MSARVIILLITTAFILLDLVTGLINAFKQKTFCSSVMREGLFHKIGSAICIALGVLGDFAQKYIDIGIEIPLTITICTYIILMEIGSIIENACSINPNLMNDKLKSFFKKLTKE